MPVNLSASVVASRFRASDRQGFFKIVAAVPLLSAALLLGGCTSQSSNSKSAVSPLTSDFGQPATASKAPVNMSKVRQYKLYIAPIIGAPLEVVTPLSFRFDTILKDQSVQLAANGESDADFTLKGYFSNMVENNQTIVLYVWDVVDKQGNRVHRLQGQEKAAGKGGWSSATAPVMGKIADDTLNDYFRWVSGNAR